MKTQDDYYKNSIDIENLTKFSKIGYNINIAPAILAITNDEYEKGIKILKRIKHPDAKIILNALEVKDKIIGNYEKTLKLFSPKESALIELSDYLNIDAEILKSVVSVEEPVKKSWHEFWQKRKLDLHNQEKLNKFYSETKSYLYELSAANNVVQTLHSYKILSKNLKNKNLGTILDYGGGIGTLAIYFKELGNKVKYADLKGETFNFAKWRFEKRKLGIEVIDLYQKDIKDIKFDTILCTEVLEHIVKPYKLIKSFNQNMNQGNTLIISESFDYIKKFCSHLPQHNGKGGNNFIKYMQENGFKYLKSEKWIPQLIFEKK